MSHPSSRGVPRATLAAVLLLAGCDKLLPRPPAIRLPRAQEVTTPTQAPVPTPAPPPAAKRAQTKDTSDAVEATAFDQIRRSLRRLVAVEQTFYAENGTYTEDSERLRYRPEGRAEVRFLWLTREGWAATGVHPALPGRDCVIWVGRVNAPPTSLKYIRSGKEGVPTCDVSPAPRRNDTTPVPPTRPLDTATAMSEVSPSVQMKVDLRNLNRAQEAWLGTQGAFSRTIEPFALQYVWHKGVTINILSADKWSWSARASFAGRPGKTCVLWFGPVPAKPATEANGFVPDRAGVPVCDD
jgi:hypothetical protein